jgi:hypothetical protein
MYRIEENKSIVRQEKEGGCACTLKASRSLLERKVFVQRMDSGRGEENYSLLAAATTLYYINNQDE